MSTALHAILLSHNTKRHQAATHQQLSFSITNWNTDFDRPHSTLITVSRDVSLLDGRRKWNYGKMNRLIPFACDVSEREQVRHLTNLLWSFHANALHPFGHLKLYIYIICLFCRPISTTATALGPNERQLQKHNGKKEEEKKLSNEWFYLRAENCAAAATTRHTCNCR